MLQKRIREAGEKQVYECFKLVLGVRNKRDNLFNCHNDCTTHKRSRKKKTKKKKTQSFVTTPGAIYKMLQPSPKSF